jgi:hypothetical protein
MHAFSRDFWLAPRFSRLEFLLVPPIVSLLLSPFWRLIGL